MHKTLGIRLGQCSEAGRHGTNQDFFGAVLPTGSILNTRGIALAIADGIGSSPVSQFASAAAVRSFLDDFYCTPESWSVPRAARQVIHASNAWLHAQTQRGDGRFDKDRGHVCAFAAVVLKGREGHLLHAGDTRLLRLHANALEPVNEVHRVRVSETETCLGRALGVAMHVEVDHHRWTLEVGEHYLLMTDGVHEHVDAATVARIRDRHADDLDAAANALVRHARTQGSTDDATVQWFCIESLPDESGLAVLQSRAELRMPPALRTGMMFEGYRIERELHCSARSTVYLATDEVTGQAVVIKTPGVDMQANPAHLDRLLLEEWIARRVDSPHVIRAARSERPRTYLFTAMEHVPGRSLAQWMTDHPGADLESVRSIIEQVARGLQAMHRRDMLHQDLRPENILIDQAGTVRIIDLGSAHLPGLSTAQDATGQQGPAGSLQFAAPETLLGDPPTPAAEVFGLATLAYHLLSGQLPYDLEVTRISNSRDLARLHYIPLRSHRPDLPPWLDAVLRKALHPQANRRQQVPSELTENLRRPGAEFHGTRPPPLIERHPVRFWQVLSALLALACLILIVMPGRGG